jgi:hypothetical protein
VTIRSEKKSAGPTSVAASPITSQCRSRLRFGPARSRCLWAFSIITIAASTMVPIAIAIPPKDMMLALMPCPFMMINAINTPKGSETMATKAERRWNRKTRHTKATTMNSWSSLLLRLSTAARISSERS